MTWVDILGLLMLGLVALGGYEQGFLRGILRLLALVGGGLLGAVFIARLGIAASTTRAVVESVVVAVVCIGALSLIGWSIARTVPRFVHQSNTNRILGVLPALLIGFAILTVAVGLAERVVPTSDQQALLRRGLLTGPLVEIVDVVEQKIAGVR